MAEYHGVMVGEEPGPLEPPMPDTLPHLSTNALLGGLRSGAELLADERNPNERRALLASMRQYLECLEGRECQNCDTCRHDSGSACLAFRAVDSDTLRQVDQWIDTNRDPDPLRGGRPLPTARNCPGWAAKG